MRARQLDFVALQQSFCFVHEQTVRVNYSNCGPMTRHRPRCLWDGPYPSKAASSKALRDGSGGDRVAFSTISVDKSVHILYIGPLSNAAGGLFSVMPKFSTYFSLY